MKTTLFAQSFRAQAARIGAAALLSFCLLAQSLSAAYPDRFVWVFGWGLGQDADVTNITRVLDTAAQHGLNGAVVSFGLDTLSKHDADYFRRLSVIQQTCERDHLELIPAVFSIGYGGGILTHNRSKERRGG